MGVPVNNPNSNRDNSPKISTSCVIWQGPNIPCIDLCTGDAIDTVVFKLATLLCEIKNHILTIDNINLDCLDLTTLPTDISEVLQIIINNLCLLNTSGSGGGGSTGRPGDSPIILDLPTCLHYVNGDGDTITSLPINDYITHLADVICNILTSITTINTTLSNFETRITAVESYIDSITPLPTPFLTVVTQCASGPIAEVITPIEEAFYFLETTFCNYITTLGSTTDLTNSINKQCNTLTGYPQLSNPSTNMEELIGWNTTPITISDTITNLWLTICDLRTAFQTLTTTTSTLPCVLVPPLVLQILSFNTSNATITWQPSYLPNIQPPTGYRIEVLFWNGSYATGSVLFSDTYSAGVTSANIASTGITSLQDYLVNVYAIYSCGESHAAGVIGNLLTTTISYNIESSDTTYLTDTSECLESSLPVTYPLIHNRTTFTLVSATTGTPVPAPVDITLMVRYEITSCEFTGSVFEDIPIIIFAGQDHIDYEYISSQYVNCGTSTCSIRTKVPHCVISISQSYIDYTGSFGIC